MSDSITEGTTNPFSSYECFAYAGNIFMIVSTIFNFISLYIIFIEFVKHIYASSNIDGWPGVDITNVSSLGSMLIGLLLPFIFVTLTNNSIEKTAKANLKAQKIGE